MAERVVVELDLNEPQDFQTICYFGCAILHANPSNIARVEEFVSQNFHKCVLHVKALDLSPDEIVTLLNAGVSRVFLTRTHVEHLTSVEGLDHGRLVVTIDHTLRQDPQDETVVVEHLQKEVASVHKLLPNAKIHLGTVNLSTLRALARDPKFQAYATCEDNTIHAARTAIEGDLTPILHSSVFGRREDQEFRNPIEAILTRVFRSDRPDGLLSTVVVDERGTCLGLVYSKDISVRESLKHGRGIYWSRKRGIWPKGESSGDIQQLVRIDVDCDNDTLRFVVRQKGDGTFDPLLLEVSELVRLLSLEDSNLLRSLLWPFQVAKDSASAKRVGPCWIVYVKTVQ